MQVKAQLPSLSQVGHPQPQQEFDVRFLVQPGQNPVQLQGSTMPQMSILNDVSRDDVMLGEHILNF